MALTCVRLAAWAQTLALPARPPDAPSGSEFARRVAALELAEREAEIFRQITSGNVPQFMRKLCPVHLTNVVSGQTNRATVYVTPDYLAIGSDADYLLFPISPNTAQKIADRLDCSLPTRKVVDEIYAAAQVKLPPTPIPPSPAMTSVSVFSNHNAIVRAQRAEQEAAHPLGALVAGHKKDVVLSGRLAASPGKVAIYGWHKTNGAPIQPLYLGHTAAWVDYSQCIRLVQQEVVLNGRTNRFSDLLANPETAGLLSDEGVISPARYSTNALAQTSRSINSPSASAPSSGFAGFSETGYLGERRASFTLAPEVKIQINAPALSCFHGGTKVLLIFYALPNGNTIPQTAGKRMEPGDDWHFDIQHIAAQTRFLRDLMPDRPIVVAYLENELKSWPAWRKKHGDQAIPEIIAAVKNIFSTNDVEIVLSGHSGGGSLIFGYLNTVQKIPEDISRIAFLDSNYAYERRLDHREKLAAWLKSSENHALCILAYHDAIALLDGKSFVSAAGGTWGKSHEMQRDLAEDFTFTTQTNAGFERYSALNGRTQFVLKENPEQKILHTVQVERNGFIHCLVAGTTNENRGYEYFGPRAYSKWIR